MRNDGPNTDRLANEYEVSKAMRIILRQLPQSEMPLMAKMLSKMGCVAPGRNRRNTDKPGAGRS
jgi:hypothetical protein